VRALVELACAGDTCAFETLVRKRTDAMLAIAGGGPATARNSACGPETQVD
jgi:hypothetical protein